jgi:hypothetical protein
MRHKLLPAAVLFALTLPYFSRLARLGDYPLHIGFALDMIRGKRTLPHPLFHACLIALIGGDNPVAAPGVAAFMMAAAKAAQAYLTAVILCAARPLRPLALTLLCLALALAMPLPNWWKIDTDHWWKTDIVLGQATPNVWHNPTGVFAVPFALALFVCSTRVLAEPGEKAAAWTGLAMVLSLLAKPSYALAFAPCLGFALLAAVGRAVRARRFGAGTGARVLLLTFGPAAVVVLTQLVVLTRDVSILLTRPFAIWELHSKNIPASVLLGVAFPLAVAVCYPRQVNRSLPLTLAWTTLGVAVASFALFAESFPRITHANWWWGLLYADQVLFVASAALLLEQRAGPARAFCFGVLGLHALSGAVLSWGSI